MKVEVDVLGFRLNCPHCLCGRKTTFEEDSCASSAGLRGFVKIEVDVLGSCP